MNVCLKQTFSYDVVWKECFPNIRLFLNGALATCGSVTETEVETEKQED